MENQPFNWTQRCCLRVYITHRQARPGAGFWQRHFGPSLGHILLQQAQKAGLSQALLLPVKAGYYDVGVISHHFSEQTPVSHPLCLEIMDTREALLAYVEQNRSLLAEAAVVLLNPETFQKI